MPDARIVLFAGRTRAGRAPALSNCTYDQRLQAVVDALQAHARGLGRLLVCGGGALNGALMRRLAAALPGVTVEPTDHHGLPVMQVEAAAFAWLAWCRIHARPGSDPAVTGARSARVLGAWHRA